MPSPAILTTLVQIKYLECLSACDSSIISLCFENTFPVGGVNFIIDPTFIVLNTEKVNSPITIGLFVAASTKTPVD